MCQESTTASCEGTRGRGIGTSYTWRTTCMNACMTSYAAICPRQKKFLELKRYKAKLVQLARHAERTEHAGQKRARQDGRRRTVPFPPSENATTSQHASNPADTGLQRKHRNLTRRSQHFLEPSTSKIWTSAYGPRKSINATRTHTTT
jgi:hypothetical protein